ncbi:MAG: sugar phosphate nucleotidyltransferase [Planctomycetota bacterium]|nr:sugar phosphate nucleotidyltransferase [Planctomycetota bacterium]
MQVNKAVITAAGRGARQFPGSDSVQKSMLPLVDRDGASKPVLQIIAEEAIESGIEKICVVCGPGDEDVYRRHFHAYAAQLKTGGSSLDTPLASRQAIRVAEIQDRLEFALQETAEGYGHAVWSAKKFVGDDPFLLLLGDHVYLSGEERRCARQLIDTAREQGKAVSAVKATAEHLIHLYGTIQGHRVQGKSGLYRVSEVIEKPNPSLAELRLMVPGLRQGHYLCFFGIHVLEPLVMEMLDDAIKDPLRDKKPIGLTPALNQLAKANRLLALEAAGQRHNLGTKFGVVDAQIAMALSGIDRDEMMELLLGTVLRIRRHEDSQPAGAPNGGSLGGSLNPNGGSLSQPGTDQGPRGGKWA